MFVRNGQVLGSVLNSAVPGAERPKTKRAEAAKPEPQPSAPPVEPVEQAAAKSPAPAVEEPPRGGPNGTREAWAEFLDGQGIDYPKDPEVAGRNDLIALWDNREGGKE